MNSPAWTDGGSSETSSRAAAGVVIAASGGTTLLMASDGAWAMSLETLSATDATTLLRALRVIYPHDSLGDQYYAAVVAALDQDAKADGETAALLKDGVAGLDQAYGIPFAELSEGNQLRDRSSAIQDTPFFQAIRGKAIVALYNNPRGLAGVRLRGRVVRPGRLHRARLRRPRLAARAAARGEPAGRAARGGAAMATL